MALLPLLFTLLAGANNLTKSYDNQFFVTKTAPNEIKFMVYNVENLYNAVDEGGHSDYTYLPLTNSKKQQHCSTIGSDYRRFFCMKLNWTTSKYKKKLEKIAQVVKAQGSLPDLLALVEIENKKVIKDLAKLLGYKKYYVTSAQHKRSQNVALLYKTKKLKPLKHSEFKNLPEKNNTRNILQANFRLLKSSEPHAVLGVYVNHWLANPAPYYLRKDSARVVMENVKKQKNHYNNYHYIIAGDFNTKVAEVNALQRTIFKKTTKAAYLAFKNKTIKKLNPPGSYFSKKNRKWSQFDGAFVSKSLVNGKGVEFIPNSYRLVFMNFMQRHYEINKSTIAPIPMRFNFITGSKKKSGYSDHLPLVFKLSI